MTADPIRALLEMVDILDELILPYAIGGSVASSVFGEPRALADADILVEIAERQLADLVARLEASPEPILRCPRGSRHPCRTSVPDR
jgi:hypothetical protein